MRWIAAELFDHSIELKRHKSKVLRPAHELNEIDDNRPNELLIEEKYCCNSKKLLCFLLLFLVILVSVVTYLSIHFGI